MSSRPPNPSSSELSPPPAAPALADTDALRSSTEYWNRLMVLCIDGGGIRGYYSLLILALLLKAIKDAEAAAEKRDLEKKEQAQRDRESPHPDAGGFTGKVHSDSDTTNNVNPGTTSTNRRFRIETANLCHYFDLMGGVSAGGIIAVLLGRLRATPEKGLQLFKEIGEKIFGESLCDHVLSVSWRKRYDLWRRAKRFKYSIHDFKIAHRTEIFEELLRKHIRELLNDNAFGSSHTTVDKAPEPLFRSGTRFKDPVCKTVVLTTLDSEANDGSFSRLLRSWERTSQADEAGHDATFARLTVREVVRATTAIPEFFEPVRIDHGHDTANGTKVQLLLSDGVVAGGSNPIRLILDDIQSEISCQDPASEARQLKMHTLVSIATGRSYRKVRERFLKWTPRKRYKIAIQKLFETYDPNKQQVMLDDYWAQNREKKPKFFVRLGADNDLPTRATEFKVVHYKPFSFRKFRSGKGSKNSSANTPEREARVSTGNGRCRTLQDMENAVEKLSKNEKFMGEVKQLAASLVETRRAREREDPDTAFRFYDQSPSGSTSESDSEASVSSAPVSTTPVPDADQ